MAISLKRAGSPAQAKYHEMHNLDHAIMRPV